MYHLYWLLCQIILQSQPSLKILIWGAKDSYFVESSISNLGGMGGWAERLLYNIRQGKIHFGSNGPASTFNFDDQLSVKI